MQISELFESLSLGIPVGWSTRTDSSWNACFTTGDRAIDIIFTRTSGRDRQSAWNVDFRKAERHDAPGTVRDTLDIMNYVASAIVEFLDTVQPARLKMNPTNQSREKLYRAILKRMTPQFEHAYSLEEHTYGTLFGEFVLVRRPEWLRSGWTNQDLSEDIFTPSASPTLPAITWKMPRNSDSYTSVWIDVAKLDASWSQDEGFYITPGGGGDSIAGRYARFDEWVRRGEPVEMPEVYINTYKQCATFGNGRHRFSWMRDHGVTALPVCVATEQAKEIRKLFGTRERVSNLTEAEYYRGSRGNPERSKRPTLSFTTDPDVASVYASVPGKGEYGQGAQVSKANFDLQNPVDLSHDEQIDLNSALDAVGVNDASQCVDDVVKLVLGLARMAENDIPFDYKVANGLDWVELARAIRRAANREDWDRFFNLLDYTVVDAYALCDTKTFVRLAKQNGFDGIIHMDVFDAGAKLAPALIGKTKNERHLTYRPFGAVKWGVS